jgi:hypothetical protein
MARKSFTEHPQFNRAGFVANEVLQVALEDMGLEQRDLNALDNRANRIVDDLTRLLLSAYDAKQCRTQKAA